MENWAIYIKTSRVSDQLFTFLTIDGDVIIFDIGSYVCKVDKNDADSPGFIIPTVLGTPKFNGKSTSAVEHKYGLNAYKNAPNISLTFPLESSTDIEWLDFTEYTIDTLNNLLWTQSDTNLSTELSSRSLIFTERTGNSALNRQKLCEIAFETLEISGLQILNQAVCSLSSYGLTSGLVVDSGESQSTIDAIFDAQIQRKFL